MGTAHANELNRVVGASEKLRLSVIGSFTQRSYDGGHRVHGFARYRRRLVVEIPSDTARLSPR